MLECFDDEEFDFANDSKIAELSMETIKGIRNIRVENDIKPSQKLDIKLLFDDRDTESIFEEAKSYLSKMASVDNIVNISDEQEVKKEDVAIHLDRLNIYVDMSNAIDKEAEILKLQKELENHMKELKRAQGMLSNTKFVEKAPENLIQKEKEKVVKYTELIEKVTARIDNLK